MIRDPALGWAEPPPQLATFRNDGYDQLVVVRAIPFRGCCDHQAMPVAGTAHIGHLPGDLMLGAATLGPLVEYFASRQQSHGLLAQKVAENVHAQLRPRGIGVVVEAEPSRMASNCVTVAGPTLVTWALLGTLRTVPSCRGEFFALIGMSWARVTSSAAGRLSAAA